MAIYRCEFKIYGRTSVSSAVAASAYVTGTKQSRRGGNAGGNKIVSAVEAAAYRASASLHNDRTGETHDYGKKEHVAWSGILAPDNAPDWVYDRGKLWNTVEQTEKRKDAQLFRECLLTLPRELNDEQRIALVRAFVRDQFVSQGMIADIGIHNPAASDGQEQPHAHVMLTLRDIGPDGFGQKRRDWNDVQWGNGTARKDGFLVQRRASWADYCNAALEEAKSQARVDHRSLKARGIDRVPQPKIGKAKYAKPVQEWVKGVRDNAMTAWHRNRAIQLSRSNRPGQRRNEQMAATLAASDAMEASHRMTMRTIGHGPTVPQRDIWGRDAAELG